MIPITSLDPHQGAICLAVLRRDGFISLDAGDERGQYSSPNLLFSTGTICPLMSIRPGGRLRVEIVDGNGNTEAVSETISGRLPA